MDVRTAIERDFTIDLTTLGRRTGRPRRVEIWYLLHEDTPYVTGTPGPRDWFANVLADPQVIFHLKESITADIPGSARPVKDPDLRFAVFHAPRSDWYRSMTPIERLVAESPMIALDLDLDSAVILG